MATCKYFQDGVCGLASQFAEKNVLVAPDACRACQSHDRPMQLNSVTASLAIGALEKPVAGNKKYLFDQIQVGGPPPRPKAKPAARRGRVGVELESIIPSFFKTAGCGCKTYARKMDVWGVGGCQDRKSEIVEYLISKAADDKFAKFFPEAMTRAVANRWVEQAIKEAEKKLALALPDNGNWFVGITTAPRPDSELNTTIESVIDAGWTPTIFSEPEVDLTNLDLPWFQNETRLGVWYNWLQVAKAGVESGAENILTIQDDASFHPDSRSFTESILWPTAKAGFVSLYTPKHYGYRWKRKASAMYVESNRRPVGVNRIQTRSFWGAVALVFHRDVLAKMLEHPVVKKWKGCPPKKRSQRASVYAKRKADPALVQNSDTAIGRAILQMGRDLMFIDPSPVQHTANFSSIGHGDNKGRRNCGRCADHDIPLADQVPVDFTPVEIEV